MLLSKNCLHRHLPDGAGGFVIKTDHTVSAKGLYLAFIDEGTVCHVHTVRHRPRTVSSARAGAAGAAIAMIPAAMPIAVFTSVLIIEFLLFIKCFPPFLCFILLYCFLGVFHPQTPGVLEKSSSKKKDSLFSRLKGRPRYLNPSTVTWHIR